MRKRERTSAVDQCCARVVPVQCGVLVLGSFWVSVVARLVTVHG